MGHSRSPRTAGKAAAKMLSFVAGRTEDNYDKCKDILNAGNGTDS